MPARNAPSAPKIVSELSALRAAVGAWRLAGERVALVPTMGALHEGHFSLVRQAAEAASRVVVSIFVNRPQFDSPEDFASYPQSLSADVAKLEGTPAALVYAPSHETMYPAGFVTSVSVQGPALGLEGEARPGHFAGVATVVAKLFQQCAPDIAVFGEKDYQQLLVVRRLVKDLDLPVEIVAAPTVREADGLACSSRNQRLSPEQREIAPALYRALKELAAEVEAGSGIAQACQRAERALRKAGFDRVDYVAVRDALTLEPIEELRRQARALAALWLGRTRLIDNLPVRARPKDATRR